MRFYLGTHLPEWLDRVDVPLFVSRRRLVRRKKLHPAAGRWALDSGGFSELSLFGRWTVGPEEYAEEVRSWSERIGRLDWAAIQDWMCEPQIIEKTGLSVAEHQRRTVESLLTLRTLAPEQPWAPVLQGWEPPDYLHHAAMYRAVGVDLGAEPIVGVGSVCRRQAMGEAGVIFRSLADLGLRLHGFGVKLRGLALYGQHLASADSLAWSFDARRLGRKGFDDCPHANCANCLRYALRWRGGVLRSLDNHMIAA